MGLYEKYTINIILKHERLNTSPPKSDRNKAVVRVYSNLFSTLFEPVRKSKKSK